MPTISSSRLNPSFTPFTAFATSARVRPWSARCCRVSSARLNSTVPLSTAQVMPGGSGLAREVLPFSTTTADPFTFTLTPAGIGIGWRPMRDMRSSPDVAQDLPADPGLARLAGAENPLGGGQDGQTQTAHHRGNLLVAGVGAPAGAA